MSVSTLSPLGVIPTPSIGIVGATADFAQRLGACSRVTTHKYRLTTKRPGPVDKLVEG